MKNQVYQLRLSSKDRELLDKAAKIANENNVKNGIRKKVTISKILLNAGLEKAQKIING